MKQAVKKWLAVLSVIALLATMGATAAFTASADEINYNFVQSAGNYISMSPADSLIQTQDQQFDGTTAWLLVGPNSAYGEAVYAVPATKNFKITGTTTGRRLTFAVSADNKTWTPVEVTEVVDDLNLTGTQMDGITYYCETETEFRYIKIFFVPGFYDPGVCHIYVASDAAQPESYANEILATDPSVELLSTGTVSYDTIGEIDSTYKVFKNGDGAAVPGAFVFKANGAITDLAVDMAFGLNSYPAKSFSFAVSSDGVVFTPVMMDFVQTDAPGNIRYSTYFGTFDAADDVRYVRVYVDGSFWHKAPAVKRIRFNTVSPIAESYATYIPAGSAAVKTESEGIVTNDAASGNELKSDYLLFKDANGTAVPGYFYFESDYAIKDLAVDTVNAFSPGLHEKMAVAVSSDGETYEPLAMHTVTTSVEGHSSHLHYGTHYAKFSAKQNIRFVRVYIYAELWNKGSALKGIAFNNMQPEKATEYAYSQWAKEADQILPSEGSQVVSNMPNLDGKWTTFQTLEGGDGTGSWVFEAENAITDYSIEALTASGWGGASSLAFYVSKDGSDWKLIIPAQGNVREHNGGWTSYTCDYYGSFPAEAGIKFLKVEKDKPGVLSCLASIGHVHWNEEAYEGKVEEAGNSLTVGENVDVNFHLNLTEEVLADENLKVTVDGNEVSVDDAVQDENGNYVFPCEVTAKEMNKVVTTTVEWGNGKSETYTYSAREYCDAVLSNPLKNPELASLVKAMLNYGAYAQTYFNYNTDNLANKGVENSGAINQVTADTVAAAAKTDLPADLFGTSLVLKSETTLKFYFKTNSAVTVNGEAAELAVNGNLWQLSVPGITAKNLDEEITIVKNGVSFTFSPLSYVHKALSSETTSDALKGVMKALYLYNAAANTYAGE